MSKGRGIHELFSRPDGTLVRERVEHAPYTTPWQRGRRNISKGMRARVFQEKGRDCIYCNAPECISIDHMLPVNRGGKTTFENLFPVCEGCNASKGDRTVIEWLAFRLTRKKIKRRRTAVERWGDRERVRRAFS